MTLDIFVKNCQQRVIDIAKRYLKDTRSSAPLLQEAMAYSVFNGGKRIRPLLIYGTGQVLDIPLADLDVPACAVEFSHAYSLIHDDLPAMDNADLRRGKPTCHKAFDEAIAILAGDSLQTIAFQIIACHDANLSAQQRIAMINILAETSGPNGMAGGQALDLRSTPSSLTELIQLYKLKTGALLSACIKLAICCADQVETTLKNALEIYGENIGLAFQIQDDLLDIESNTENLGKLPGIDSINNKRTYPAIAGTEETKREISNLFEKSIAAIKPFGPKTKILEDLATYLLQRQN